jgi:hypothetical protein
MTSKSCTTSPGVRVAIDVAKLNHQVLYNLWDKNDPKDAQVILQLLKNGRRSGISTRS